MKRLFEVRGQFFDNKMKAKEHRDQLIANGDLTARVGRGPDNTGPHSRSGKSWRNK